jgi:hypothetical protein
MAKQSGIIKPEGTIGDIAFYKIQDGYLAWEKGGISADRLKSDPRKRGRIWQGWFCRQTFTKCISSVCTTYLR